jgi:hypothetical protein
MDSERLTSLEESFRPQSEGVEDVDVRIVNHTTYFTEAGERCQRTLAATYDETTPFSEAFYRPDLGHWQRCRVLEPLQESADHGILRDKEVTGD